MGLPITYTPTLSQEQGNGPGPAGIIRLTASPELTGREDALLTYLGDEAIRAAGTPTDREWRRLRPAPGVRWDLRLWWWSPAGQPINDHRALGHSDVEVRRGGISLRSSLWLLELRRPQEDVETSSALVTAVIKADETAANERLPAQTPLPRPDERDRVPRLRLEALSDRLVPELAMLYVPRDVTETTLHLRIRYYDARSGRTYPLYFSPSATPAGGGVASWPLRVDVTRGEWSPTGAVQTELALLPTPPALIGAPGTAEAQDIGSLRFVQPPVRGTFSFPADVSPDFS